MARRLPLVVATHWVHPEVTDYLKEFSLPVVPPQEPGVWPTARVLELARDAEAVADALEENRLGGYAADVFAMEDWALPGRPAEIPPRLLRHPRTLFTPHLGSAVTGTRRAMSLTAARQVQAGSRRPATRPRRERPAFTRGAQVRPQRN